MSVGLCAHLKHHSRFFQQICSHVGTDDTKAGVKADFDVFPKATAVVISGGLCISNGLRDRRKPQSQTQLICYEDSAQLLTGRVEQ